MSTVRQPIWTGRQTVSALWFDAGALDAATRETRLFHAWQAGCQALRFAEGDLLRLPAATLADCATLPGLALCRLEAGPLCSAPLTPEEQRAVGEVDVVLIRGARPIGLRYADAQVLDLAAWIEIGPATLHDTFDCSSAPAPPALPRLQGQSAREALGSHIPPSEERERFLQQIVAGGTRSPRAGGAGSTGLLDRMLGWLMPHGDGAGRPGLPPASTRGDATGGRSRHPGPPPPSTLRRVLTRLALTTRISGLIGWRQGAYLRRMMQRFEDGDLMEALRHALPIDGSTPSLGQAFGTPGRRDSLQLGRDGRASVDLYLDTSLRDHLRDLYRRSFEQLDRAGRVDEAAFVLGELLNAQQECLDYLERHQRYLQAAELALAWELGTARVLRLLLLAGDPQRALQLARRTGDFAGAVQLLEADHPAQARKLRLWWGESLADRGEWLAAVEAVWPVPEARTLAIGWLRTAEDAGETLGARALVHRAERLPDTLQRYGEQIRALSRPGSDPADAEAAAQARLALAEALLTVRQPSPAVAAIANALLPAIAADRALGRNALGKSRLNQLLSLGGDPYLKADLPAWDLPPVARRPSLWARGNPLILTAPTAGLARLQDVTALPEQRYLIALGEAGVQLIDAQGRVLQRYAVPAESLVIADNGRIALAIATRETQSRVSRIDLLRRRCTDLGSLRIDAHAPHFDGSAWSIVADNRILVIDTAKSLREVVWHVGDLPGRLRAAQYRSGHEFYLLETPQGLEHWIYQVPARRLTHRAGIAIDPTRPFVLKSHGGALQPRIDRLDDTELRIAFEDQSRHAGITLDSGGDLAGLRADQIHLACDVVGSGLIVAGFLPGRTTLAVCGPTAQVVARLHWPGDAVPRVRADQNRLLLFDNRGRLLDLGTEHASVTSLSVG